jgi:homoserine O-acetyltransferase
LTLKIFSPKAGISLRTLRTKLESSSDHDLTELIARIRAQVLATNFTDDELNPPQLRIVEKAIARL